MKEIFRKIKAFYTQKKKLAVGVTVAVLGLLAAVGVYAMIPEVKAEVSTPTEVSTPGEYFIRGNETYVIKAGTYTDTFKFVHIGDGEAIVKLEGVNFRLSTDIPAIEFVGDTSASNSENTKQDTEATSYAARFNVVIEGQNSITSTCSGAKNPLIKIENKEYDVIWYVYDEKNFGLSGKKEGRVKQTCTVRFSGDVASDNSSLVLQTASGSYGAAIGSSEIAAMAAGIDRLNTTKELNPSQNIILSNGQTIKQTFDGQEAYNGNLKGGCGNITVSTGANIFINALGYGPGIGTGGSASEAITFDIDEEVATTHWSDTATSIIANDNREVKVTGGNLVIQKDTPGYCIGMGAIAGARTGNETRDRVQITGGNLKLTEGSEFINAVDASGRKVFRYDFDITSIINNGGMTSGESYQISRETSGQLYEVKQTGGNVSNKNDALQLGIWDEDEVNQVYSFEGKVAPYFNYATNETKMYFYLYAVELSENRLTVSDDITLDGVHYQYRQYRSDNADGIGFRNLTKGTSVPIRATRAVDIQISGVPNYCTNIIVKEGSQNKGNATKNADGTYSYSTIMPETDLNISFEYEMATYKINYELGKAGNNADNSANALTGSYGREHPLAAPSWDGYAFKGWYWDEACTEPVQNNTLPAYDELIEGESVTVYAQWGGAVIFTTESEGVLSEEIQILVDLGTRFTKDMLPTEAILKEKGWDSNKWSFTGFKINGSVYGFEDDFDGFEVNRNTEIEMIFEPVGYSVKINAMLEFRGRITPVDINEISDFSVFFKGQPKEFTVDPADDTYTYTSLYYANEQGETTGVIRANGGYQIRKSEGIVVTDEDGNVIENFMNIDDKDAFTFDMPTRNVEITVYFQEPDYTVSYYEYIEEDGKDAVENPLIPIETEDNPTVYEFNAETPDFKLNPAKPSSKYKRFVGWYVFGDPNLTIIDTVHQGEYSKNLILIAKWEDVLTYPITINEEAKEYIKVYDSDGMEVDKGIPGERLTIVVTPKRGVSYDKMTWYYTDQNNSNCVRENTPAEDEKAPYEYPFIMPPASPVDIVGEFSLINYNITYLNLYGAKNPNPITYTVEDKIELEPLQRDGADFEGWKIVVHDENSDIPNEDYVTKEEDISTIEDMTGNLILVAHWDKEGEINTLHKIFVNGNFVNGTMDSFANEAYSGQYVFLSVAPNAGYKLKGISYNDAEPAVYSAEKALRAVENLLDISIDVPVFEVADGIYYFIMPDHDVNLAAEFEPIEYSITYLEGSTEANPTIYTVEDEIQLTAPSKDGFEFLGWYDTEDNLVEAIINSTGNLTLTAKWKQIANEEPPTPPVEPEPPTEPDNKNADDKNPEPPANNNPPQDKDDKSDVIDQLLSWINNNSKINSSEDKSAQNNTNKGNAGQQLSTGDTANISHLMLLCIMSLIIIIIACPKKKEEEAK